jgi:hypothetical protein
MDSSPQTDWGELYQKMALMSHYLLDMPITQLSNYADNESVQLYPTLGPHITQAVYQNALDHIAPEDVSLLHSGCRDEIERFGVEIDSPTWHKLSFSHTWWICHPSLAVGLQIRRER